MPQGNVKNCKRAVFVSTALFAGYFGGGNGWDPDFEETLVDAAKQLGIELIKASDYNNSR